MPELISIDTIGETITESLTAYFNRPSAQKLLQELRDSGLSMEYLGTVEEEAPDNFFKEETVVLTGELSDFTRSEFTKKLQNLRAKVTGSVSKKTDYLIYDADAGSKKGEAEKLQVPTLIKREAIAKIGK